MKRVFFLNPFRVGIYIPVAETMGMTGTVEELMTRLEEGIAKACLILDEYPRRASFTAEEYMTYYDCVYVMCVHHFKALMLQRFEKALEESIRLKVLPSLCDKEGAPLLAQFLHMWSSYKAMSKCLGIFFLYLDREFNHGNIPRLEDVATRHFDDLVCWPLLQKLFSAAGFLIAQDRNGEFVDRNLLQNMSTFFMEMGGRANASYYDNFEAVVLADTANYYSCLASKWLLCYSSTDYVLKVDQCLNQEKERACQFLYPPSVEKLLQTMHLHLMDQNANKLNEKRRAENQELTTYEGLLSRCAKLSIQ